MKIRWSTAWLCLIPLLLSWSWLGGIIHESDQASVMLGALRLVRGGAPWIGPDFYEYGNYFFSYWILAAAYKLFPSADVVWLGNFLSLMLFWLGVFILMVLPGKKPSRSRWLACFVALSSPAVLVHVPYFAPIYISAGFLCAGAGVYARSPRNFPWALGCWGLAFACRADAILLVPLLAWFVADEAGLGRLVCSAKSWSLAGAALGVAVMGRLVNPGAAVLGYRPFFYPEVYAVYLIFGAAAATGLLALFCWRLLREGAVASRLDARLYWWGGAAALLIPFVFYSLFMTSPRHWTLLIGALLILAGSGRIPLDPVSKKIVLPGLAICSALLLLVGVRLPELARPRLTVTRPELFPTGDGRCPMGAVIPFMYSGRRLDHNQQTWLAAQDVPVWEEHGGVVPLSWFPLSDIVRLSIFSRSGQLTTRSASLPDDPFVYISTRAILRPEILVNTKTKKAADVPLRSCRIEPAGAGQPMGMLRVSAESSGGEESWSPQKKRLLLFVQAFQGNDVAPLPGLPAGRLPRLAEAEGRPLLLWSGECFSVQGDGRKGIARRAEDLPGIWFMLLASGDPLRSGVLSAPVELATTVYPDYMNVQTF